MHEITGILPNNCVMTLKDVVDFINNERGVTSKEKGYIQHGIAMTTIVGLSNNTDFGQVKEFLTSYSKGNRSTGSIKTYALTKKQAIASGARLDNTMLMKVINRVEELESKSALPDFSNPIEAARAWADAKELEQQALIAQKEAEYA